MLPLLLLLLLLLLLTDRCWFVLQLVLFAVYTGLAFVLALAMSHCLGIERLQMSRLLEGHLLNITN